MLIFQLHLHGLENERARERDYLGQSIVREAVKSHNWCVELNEVKSYPSRNPVHYRMEMYQLVVLVNFDGIRVDNSLEGEHRFIVFPCFNLLKKIKLSISCILIKTYAI